VLVIVTFNFDWKQELESSQNREAVCTASLSFEISVTCLFLHLFYRWHDDTEPIGHDREDTGDKDNSADGERSRQTTV
jgi:formate-dependent phosphoribosylglycinamide formyltransferase (GAR transformylase)